MAGYELKKHEKALLINLTATEHEPALRAILSNVKHLQEENERLKSALSGSRLRLEEKDRTNGELYREREMLQRQVECLEDHLASLQRPGILEQTRCASA